MVRVYLNFEETELIKFICYSQIESYKKLYEENQAGSLSSELREAGVQASSSDLDAEFASMIEIYEEILHTPHVLFTLDIAFVSNTISFLFNFDEDLRKISTPGLHGLYQKLQLTKYVLQHVN